jgi:hypothetical protein
MKSSSGVEIHVRIRPPKGTVSRALNVVNTDTITIDPSLERRGSFSDRDGENKSTRGVSPVSFGNESFRFHKVFDMNTTNEQIYYTVAQPLVKSVLDGVNCTIMCYGASGSGKTHTMLGEEDNQGIIPRILKDMFKAMDDRKLNNWSIDTRVSFTQIYMDKVLDLLKSEPVNVDTEPSLHLRQRIDADGAEEVYIEGISSKKVNSVEKSLAYLSHGNTNKVVASTDVNTFSSRSHSIFIIRIEQTHSDGDHLVSSLYLVDLAGSEKAKKTNAEGVVLSQACYVNKSLTILSNVISALSKRKPHIPYRDSKLTRLLTHSLGGNSKTIMILACSRDEPNIDETIATLKFGKRALSLPNRPKVNHVMTVDEYKLLLEKAEHSLQTQKTVIESLERENATLRNQSEPTKVENIRRQIGHFRKSLGKTEDFQLGADVEVEDDELKTDELKAKDIQVEDLDARSEIVSVASTDDDMAVNTFETEAAHIDFPVIEEEEEKREEKREVVATYSPHHFTPRAIASLSNELVITLQEENRELQEKLRDFQRNANTTQPTERVITVPTHIPTQDTSPPTPIQEKEEQKRDVSLTAPPQESHKIIFLAVGGVVMFAFLITMIVLRNRYNISWQTWLLVIGFGLGMLIAGWGCPSF